MQGLSIRELSSLSALNRSTVRRLLMVLVQTGFAAKDEQTRRYRLGVEAMLTGIAALAKAPVFEVCHPAMVNIARRTGDSVFLVIRIGDFAHCLHVEAGNSPLHAHSLMAGQIRLLGQGTASLALAATLRDKELDQIYQRRQLDYEAAGISQAHLQNAVQQTRRLQHSESVNSLTSGASGVGIAISFQAAYVTAISVASNHLRMTPEHKTAILSVLRHELCKVNLRPFTYM